SATPTPRHSRWRSSAGKAYLRAATSANPCGHEVFLLACAVVALAPEGTLFLAEVVECLPTWIELKSLVVVVRIGAELRPRGRSPSAVGITRGREARPVGVHRVADHLAVGIRHEG